MPFGGERFVPPEALGAANEPHLVSHIEEQTALRETSASPEATLEQIPGGMSDETVEVTVNAPGEGEQGGIPVVPDVGEEGFEERSAEWREGVVDAMADTAELAGGMGDETIDETYEMTPEEQSVASHERQESLQSNPFQAELMEAVIAGERAVRERQRQASREAFAEKRATVKIDGDVLRFGELEVVRHEKIGEGAMGEVWRVEGKVKRGDGTLEPRTMVLKTMRAEILQNTSLRDRFLTEIDETDEAGLLVDAGTTEDGSQEMMLLELAPGDDMADVMRFERGDKLANTSDGRRALAVGLRAVLLDNRRQHVRGFEHRDMKPSNTRFHEQAPHMTRALDYGIAQQHEKQDLTEDGENAIVGSPAYMLPGVLRGQKYPIGARDLYADVAMFGEAMHWLQRSGGENLMSLYKAQEMGRGFLFANPANYRGRGDEAQPSNIEGGVEAFVANLKKLGYADEECELAELMSTVLGVGKSRAERAVDLATWGEPEELKDDATVYGGDTLAIEDWAWKQWESGKGLTIDRFIGALDGIIARMNARMESADQDSAAVAEMERYAATAKTAREKAWFEFDTAGAELSETQRSQGRMALLQVDRMIARADFGQAQRFLQSFEQIMIGEDVDVAAMVVSRAELERQQRLTERLTQKREAAQAVNQTPTAPAIRAQKRA